MWNWIVLWTFLHSVQAKQMPPTDWDIRANLQPSTQRHILNRPNNQNGRIDYIEAENIEDSRFLSKDCLDGIRDCELQNGICRVDLEIFKQFCGDWRNERSLLGCNKKVVKECRSALRTVNDGRLGLKHCTCDSKPSRSIDDLSKCNLLRRNLNSHPCLHEPPLIYRDGLDSWQDISLLENNQKIDLITTQQARNVHSLVKHEEMETNFTEKVKNLIVATLPTITMESGQMSHASPNDLSINVTRHFAETLDHQTNETKPELNSSIAENSLPVAKQMEPSCLDLLDRCTSHPTCAKDLNRFRALCTPRSCEKLRSHCVQAHKDFQLHGATENCSCAYESDPTRKQRCYDYELRVLQNTCVYPEYYYQHKLQNNANKIHPLVKTLDTMNMTNVVFSPDQMLLKESNIFNDKTINQSRISVNNLQSSGFINCYDVYRNCVKDADCLVKYLRLARLCSLQGQCHPVSYCEEITRNFYKNSISQQALGCSCAPSDSDCIQQQTIFLPQCLTVDNSSILSCSSIWDQCSDNGNCNDALWFLITKCQPRSNMCQTSPSECLTAYRKIWLQNMVRQCRCNMVKLKIYHTVSMEQESLTFRCEAFQRLLVQPPCQDLDAYYHVTNKNIEINEIPQKFTDACRISNTLNLSPETIVRVYPKTEDMNHSPYSQQDQQVCSQLCGCINGCLHHLCFPEFQQQQQQRMLVGGLVSHNRMQLTAGKQTGRQRQPTATRITPQAVCHYLPLADPKCACLSDGDVYCTGNPNYVRLLNSSHLQITYARDEFSTILGLLDQTVSTNEFQYYVQLLNMAGLLKSVVKNATGNANCGLVLARHHIPQTRVEAATHSPTKTTSRTVTMGDEGQLTYFIAVTVNSSPGEYGKQAAQPDAYESCLQSIQLLQLMINRRFPQIYYHPLLSVLKQAALVNRPGSSMYLVNNKNRSRLKETELTTSTLIDQQSTWRKPRTSHKKLLEPITVAHSQGTRWKSDRIWAKSILGFVLFNQIALGWFR